MYTGKSVIIGADAQGNNFLAYRLTSKSMPEREIRVIKQAEGEDGLTMARVFTGIQGDPERDYMWGEPYLDPYPSVEAFLDASKRVVAVASNGHQTNRIRSLMQRGGMGLPLFDAMVSIANTYGYERHDVGRVYGGLCCPSEDEREEIPDLGRLCGVLGTHFPGSLHFQTFVLEPMLMRMVCSAKDGEGYEDISELSLQSTTVFRSPQEVAEFIATGEQMKHYSEGEMPVNVAAALIKKGADLFDIRSFDVGVYNGGDING